MDKERAERIQRFFYWVRIVILVLFLAFVFIGLSKAQNTNDFGMWISAGTEKNVNDSWSLGVSSSRVNIGICVSYLVILWNQNHQKKYKSKRK